MDRRYLILWALGCVACMGCGAPPTSAVVRGRVEFGTEPLPGGLIRFYSKTTAGRWSGATIEADGRYVVPDVPLGLCTVTVDTSNLKNIPAPRRLPGVPLPPGVVDDAASQPVYRAVAPRFAAAQSSPLAVEVKPGENVHDIQVE
jgi:hypothetical protein